MILKGYPRAALATPANATFARPPLVARWGQQSPSAGCFHTNTGHLTGRFRSMMGFGQLPVAAVDFEH